MPTLERTCFLCGETVVLVSTSPGPYAAFAGGHGRALCDDCIRDRAIDVGRDSRGAERIAWPDGDVFRRIGGVFIGSPDMNPASPHHIPPGQTEH
jgi:hypothetical protein